MFVGEAPGQAEYNSRLPFVGPAGSKLSEIINEALEGYNLKWIITNAVLCTTWDDEWRNSWHNASLSEVKACRGHLLSLIEIIQPRLIVALGKVAERSVKPLGYKFKTIQHPSAIEQSTHKTFETTKAIVNLRHYIKDIT